MHRSLRNTHLFAGLFSALFLLMYGVSSVQMSHNSWFALKPAVVTAQLALPPGATDARVVARELMDRGEVRGDIAQASAAAGRLRASVVRPGAVADIDYDGSTGTTALRTSRNGFMGVLNRLHHGVGVRHDYVLLNLWGVLIGLVSAALFVLGVTGVYLWFKLHDERVIGAVLLAVTLAYTLPLIVWLRVAW